MTVADTSLAAHRSLDLLKSEADLMRLVHLHYPFPASFTRKELSAKSGWEINRVTGRVNSLVSKGYLTEYQQTRDGGHLLSISPPSRPAAAKPVSVPAAEKFVQDERGGEPSATAGSGSRTEASLALADEASGGQSAADPFAPGLVTTWNSRGEEMKYTAQRIP